MIETLVQYLHGARVPFRFASYPSEESVPVAAHPIPHHGMLVDTRIVLLDGHAMLAGFAAGEQLDLGALSAALGGVALEGDTSELPHEFANAAGSIPPLGQLFGLPLVLDARVAGCAVIVFRAFDGSDYFDIPYEDFARLEQPRIAAFASIGQLVAASPPRAD
jgi:Ala-tRNA(Pro) deacylase